MFCHSFRSNARQIGKIGLQHYFIGRVAGLGYVPSRHLSKGSQSTELKVSSPTTRRTSHHILFTRERSEGHNEYGFRYADHISKFIGVLGTFAVIGLGSAACEKEEEKAEINSKIPSKFPEKEQQVSEDIKSKTFPSGDAPDVLGKDVVGTEKPVSEKLTDAACQSNKLTKQEAINKSRQLLKRRMEEAGAPGMVVAVSIDGKNVWADGFGFADIENNVRCKPDTVMRIASISKSITMTEVAKLWEDGKIDLDAPIQKYVPNFPVKTFEGEEVTITTRHLISHKSGIRHYKLKNSNKKDKVNNKSKQGSEGKQSSSDPKSKVEENEKQTHDSQNEESKDVKKPKLVQKKSEASDKLQEIKPEENSKELSSREENEGQQEEKALDKKEESKIVKSVNEKSDITKEKSKKSSGNAESEKGNAVTIPLAKRAEIEKLLKSKMGGRKKSKKKKEEEDDEFDMEEYYIQEKFETIEDALKLFQDDELFFKPGSGFMYTTHGWTVVSAVVEGASGKPFTRVITRLFHDLGLDNTYLDDDVPIIYNRARYYVRSKHGKLQNAPYVNNSYKWAGGGFLSTVRDLNKFGNAMLYASQQGSEQQQKDSGRLPGFLKASTIHNLWTPVTGTNMGWDRDGGYGMGWGAVEEKTNYGFCRECRHYASHTGGAVGASSVLLILPQQKISEQNECSLPKGVVVSIISNMQGVGLNRVALQIAKLFEDVKSVDL